VTADFTPRRACDDRLRSRLARQTETGRSKCDRAHARASRSRLGIETRCALSGVCAGKNVAGFTVLSHKGASADQRAYADENLWDHIPSVPGRTFHSFAGGRISRERRVCPHFLRVRPDLHSRARCSAERGANLHWRWCHGYALVYSQTRQSTHRSLACSDPTDMV